MLAGTESCQGASKVEVFESLGFMLDGGIGHG
jgi:hypothetical protein